MTEYLEVNTNDKLRIVGNTSGRVWKIGKETRSRNGSPLFHTKMIRPVEGGESFLPFIKRGEQKLVQQGLMSQYEKVVDGGKRSTRRKNRRRRHASRRSARRSA